jgi:hypothetical protein
VDSDRRPPPGPRAYPRKYEKLIPIAMFLLLAALALAAVLALAVGLGWLP